MLSVSLPFTMLMLMAGACLRGGGDTVTPAVIMVLVDLINMVSSFALTRGWWGLPVMGFSGIALGTIIAYVVGGVVQFIVLSIGTRGAKLHLHRMWPHWHTIKRLLRIGVPTGVGGMIDWFANFGVVSVVNHMDPTNASSAAHMNTIRLESISFLSGIAFATAAATMVGISLGRKDPARAQRCAYLCYAVGGGIMIVCGLLMITLGRYAAHWLSPHDLRIIALTTHCVRITGFIQAGFAANLIFGFSLRGAGDTLVITLLNLTTILGVRFVGVLIVGLWLHLGLEAVWMVLAGELFLRGCITYGRFVQGAWKHVQV
jgi:Na+-driven multidrug efflux pump